MKTAGAAAVLVLLTFALWSAAGRQAWVPLFPADGPHSALPVCSASDEPNVTLSGWTDFTPGTWTGTEGQLLTPASLTFDACASGWLTLSVSSQAVREWGALLLVNVDRRPVGIFEVSGRRTFRVRIPTAGTVRLAFPNDLYESEQRTLLIQELSLQGDATCGRRPEVRVAQGDGSWQNGSGLLRGTAALTLSSCGAGTLRISAFGTAAAGQGARLDVTLAGRLLRSEVVTGGTQLNVSVPGSGEIELRLANGYFRELADRNLTVHVLTFAPDGVPEQESDPTPPR